MNVEERLIEIEIKIAHQENLIGELNQVISRQQETLDQLREGLKKFFKHYREINGDKSVPTGSGDEKPPHY